MKRILILFVFAIAVFTGCGGNGTDSVDEYGDIIITSTPSGADIFINNVYTGRSTPFLFNSLNLGTIIITLTLPGYEDTTFLQQISHTGVISIHTNLAPVSELTDTIHYKGIKLYQFINENAEGIDLSTAKVMPVDSPSVDIFSDAREGFRDLRSQHLKNEFLTNRTFFLNSTAVELNDGDDSGLYEENNFDWIFHNNNNNGYSFIFDKDGHYSKLKIIDTGDEGPYRRYVIIDYIYNRNPNDPRF